MCLIQGRKPQTESLYGSSFNSSSKMKANFNKPMMAKSVVVVETKKAKPAGLATSRSSMI